MSSYYSRSIPGALLVAVLCVAALWGVAHADKVQGFQIEYATSRYNEDYQINYKYQVKSLEECIEYCLSKRGNICRSLVWCGEDSLQTCYLFARIPDNKSAKFSPVCTSAFRP